MEAKTTIKKAWVTIAADELKCIQNRWKNQYNLDISSFRKLKNVLKMNDRTLRKLNQNHLDYSLKLESVIELYNRLFVICEHFLDEDDRNGEHLLLMESERKVLKNVGGMPTDILENAAGWIGGKGTLV